MHKEFKKKTYKNDKIKRTPKKIKKNHKKTKTKNLEDKDEAFYLWEY